MLRSTSVTVQGMAEQEASLTCCGRQRECAAVLKARFERSVSSKDRDPKDLREDTRKVDS
eukprot:692299-Hanusia_phi.AAC.2